MKRKLALVAALLLVAAAGIVYYYYSVRNNELTQVKVIKSVRAELAAKVYTTGKIDLQNKQEVRVLTPGMIKAVSIAVGDKVKKGDLLLELESKDLDLQIKQAQASVQVAKANFNAINDKVVQLERAMANPEQAQTSGSGGIPGVIGDQSSGSTLAGTLQEAKNSRSQAQAVLNQAQAALDMVRSQKDNTRITAALDGTVLAVSAAANQPAVAQVPLAIVGDLEHLVVVAEVNEVDAGKLAQGQVVKISGATLGDREFGGKVIAVSPIALAQPSLQGNQTTVQAKVQLDQPDPALKPGFSVSLTIITSSKPNVLQIPQEAVFTQDKLKYVYMVDQGSLSRKQVTTGISGDINVEILSGINEGDQVVLNPSKNLREGLKVRVE
ncbi:MAG TPA: efflux RND transporter periplasmic adaptor subunit [Candidatus Deferrimicrobium sp.]|nr:efflux RND transporter periplasmic adaptor subunit [Candidatus Deferrimicrobium sp.]